MSRRTEQTLPRLLQLRQARENARQKLQERIDKAKTLLAPRIMSQSDTDAFNVAYDKWDQYNVELLNTLYTTDDPATEYSWCVPDSVIPYNEGVQDKARRNRDALTKKTIQLESLLERLELIPVAAIVGGVLQQVPVQAAKSTDKVFIVHGHDAAIRESVARLVEQLGLTAIVLHERPNGGRTVIEKLEHHSAVGFAIVLLTPDDEGRERGTDGLRPRARQNVLLELGYFVGLLGRNKVCALHRGPLELPSDILGVVYVPIDDAGGWRLQIAKELRAAGFTIDMNKVV